MMQGEMYKEKFDALKVCVIIPTYNNAGTLLQVLESVRHYTNNIIVVNDGSTDKTAALLQGINNIEIVGYTPNRGKVGRCGQALARQ